MRGTDGGSIFARCALLPNNFGQKIPPPEYLVHDDFEIMSLIVIDRHPDTTVLGEQFAQQLQPRPDHGQPLAMFQLIAIMLKGDRKSTRLNSSHYGASRMPSTS